MFKKIARNTSISSLGMSVSLIMGFVRNILIASIFGTSAILEAFIVAFRLPNLFRSILGEGFTDSVATPVLSKYREDRPKLFEAGRSLLSFSAIALFLATILGILFAKYLVIIIAPGFLDDPVKFNMTVSFTRITFLYLFFIGLSVNSFSILYVLKKFFVPSITPAFLNISFIIGLLFFKDVFKNYILIICVLTGGVLQTIVPFIALKKEGFSFKPKIRNLFKDKDLIKMLKLSPPRVISSIVYQLSVILDTVFASFAQIVGHGAIAAIWFANCYIHLPLALFIHPICRVAIVDLSYYHSQGNMDDFKKLFVFSFQNIIFFIVPIAITYIFLSQEIIDVILKRGDFNMQSLLITSSVFYYYSFGLFFFCGIKLLVNSFYALKDTLIPAKVTAFSLLLNAVLSAILMFPLKIGGVALGSSIAAMVNFFILYIMLRKRIGTIDWKDTKAQFVKILLLSLAVAAMASFAWDFLIFNKYIKALIVVASAFGIFILGAYFLRFKQVLYIKEWILKKK